MKRPNYAEIHFFCISMILIYTIPTGHCADTPSKKEEKPSVFTALGLSKEIRHWTVNESGTQLYAIAGDKSRIVKYDVATGKRLTSPGTGSFDMLLSRGTGLYALSSASSEVLQLSPKDLTVKGRMTVSAASPFYLSAPRGKHFTGAVFVSCNDGRICQELRFPTKTVKNLKVGREGVKTMAYDGSIFISQRFDLSPSGVPTAHAFGAHRNEGRGDHDDTPYLQQFQAGDFWFGFDSVYAGSPPRLASPRYRGYVLPELGGNSFYLVMEDRVVQFEMTYPFTPVKVWPVRLPKSLLDAHFLQRAGGVYFHNLASRTGNKINLFIFNSSKSVIWQCRLTDNDKVTTITENAPNQIGMEPAFSEDGHFSYTKDGKGIVFLNGMSLRFFSLDGRRITRELPMPAHYRKVFDRGSHLIAIGRMGLHILDRESGRVKTQIITSGTVHDLAPHPTKAVSYVVVDDSENFTRDPALCHRIAVLNEKTGAINLHPRAVGSQIVCDPMGRYLYASLKHRVFDGWSFSDLGYKYEDYRETRILLRYALDGPLPRLAEVSSFSGGNPRALVASSDGRYLSVVSGGGIRDPKTNRIRYAIPSFKVDELTRMEAAFEVGTYPEQIAYHPSMNIVVGTNGKALSLFDSAGRRLPKAMAPFRARKIFRMAFSPDGTGLVVHFVSQRGFRVVQRLALNPTAANAKKVVPASTPVKLPSKNLEEELLKTLNATIYRQLTGKSQ